MDASDKLEQDVVLQLNSSKRIADFADSLRPFLYHEIKNGPPGPIRSRVRKMEMDRLIGLLEPFQELPQLLDPHLNHFVPILSEALLANISIATPILPASRPNNMNRFTSTNHAVSKLLYTFCKIRGEKVIVRFFSSEARFLEPLLNAFAGAEKKQLEREQQTQNGEEDEDQEAWGWEERYICLLWLSHLFLAPFDLSTISSGDVDQDNKPKIRGLDWPENVPGITLKIVPWAIKYLGSAGKERDAAKALLVRVSMRRDMQEIGFLDAAVNWAMTSLKEPETSAIASAYFHIGILAYLAGILQASLSTSVMDRYLLPLFRVAQNLKDIDNPAYKTVHTSAVARKTVIKVVRTIAMLVLRPEYVKKGNELLTMEIVEDTVGDLLDAQADNDTPVRLAASKALSMVTLKLEPYLAEQVVDAVLESLQTNVLWVEDGQGQRKRDLTSVNALEWHGLILTLSHLLYRRSPPPNSLGRILEALLVGLSFERRSTAGASVGTNVRDAACFGVWATARRYTTAELLAIDASTLEEHTGYLEKTILGERSQASTIQILATNLIVAASMDPAGNIRRGSSAALQELIGRHPNTVTLGIELVQAVDYHAIALRSRAVLEVAPAVADMHKAYTIAILEALLGWRGAGDGDAKCRRTAAEGMGIVAKHLISHDARSHPDATLADWLKNVTGLVATLVKLIESCKPREVEMLHGLVLELAETVSAVAGARGKYDECPAYRRISTMVLQVLEKLYELLKTTRKKDLVIECACRLISGAIQVMTTSEDGYAFLDRGPETLGATRSIIESALLSADSKDNILPAIESARSLLLFLDDEREEYVATDWLKFVESETKFLPGYLWALCNHVETLITYNGDDGTVYRREMVENTFALFKKQWHLYQRRVEYRALLLQMLSLPLLHQNGRDWTPLLMEGLDDYTTDSRGDIGSLVRIEALKATQILLSIPPLNQTEWDDGDLHLSPLMRMAKPITKEDRWNLLAKVLRLAAEKMDRVRAQAQECLMAIVSANWPSAADGTINTGFMHNEQGYFKMLLEFLVKGRSHVPGLGHDGLMAPLAMDLMEGYVTSADAGSESLIRVSRAALIEFCEQDPCHAKLVTAALLKLLREQIAGGSDRVLIPAMSVLSLLFDAGILQGILDTDIAKAILILTQKAHYKTQSVRKLEVAVKLYGGLLSVSAGNGRLDGGPLAMEANRRAVLTKLTSMLLHNFPSVRNLVADELFVWTGRGKGINWPKARKEDVAILRRQLGLE